MRSPDICVTDPGAEVQFRGFVWKSRGWLWASPSFDLIAMLEMLGLAAAATRAAGEGLIRRARHADWLLRWRFPPFEGGGSAVSRLNACENELVLNLLRESRFQVRALVLTLRPCILDRLITWKARSNHLTVPDLGCLCWNQAVWRESSRAVAQCLSHDVEPRMLQKGLGRRAWASYLFDFPKWRPCIRGGPRAVIT